MTKADYIQWLEAQILNAQGLGGMELEIWAFRQCLKMAQRLDEKEYCPECRTAIGYGHTIQCTHYNERY